jgi:hypothetical protein
MKSLYNKLETELNSNLYLCHDFNEIEKEFLRLTKEWLEKFRNVPTYRLIDCENNLKRETENKFLDCLLKEVQK